MRSLRRHKVANKLRLKGFRLPLLLVGLVVFALASVLLVTSVTKANRSSSEKTLYIPEDVPKGSFTKQQDFSLQAEQDEDAPLKILDAKSSVISGNHYQELTSETANSEEVVSVPKVILKNVSGKNIVGITLMIVDKGSKVKQGYYIKEQSVKPGQEFVILPENIVPSAENPAKNPKFWLNVSDKSKVKVRVVAFFEDGSMWANKNQR